MLPGAAPRTWIATLLILVSIALLVTIELLRRRAERYLSRLRNAWVSGLSAYTGMSYRFGDVPDADRIAQILPFD